LDLCDLLGLLVLTVIDGFVFCRRDVADRAVQPVFVPPGDPLEGRQLDLPGAWPRAAATDQLGLVQAVDRLGQSVVVGVALGPDRGDGAFGGQALGVADRQVLGCTPRSEWCTRPSRPASWRAQTAISRASRARVACRVVATRQPTIMRLKASMTNAT
jgi:hypothetical protein